MIGPLQRYLRRIRYYSASTERSVWHTVADAALFATFIASFLAAFLADRLIDRSVLVAEYDGQLLRAESGRIIGRLVDKDAGGVWSGGMPVGEFGVEVVDRLAGWPLVSRRDELPPTVSVQVFSGMDVQDVELGQLISHGVDVSISEAIHNALGAHPDRYDRRSSATSSWYWSRWLVNSGMLWAMLYILCMIAIPPLRIGVTVLTHVMSQRKRRLRQSGLCDGCGYDLRGLEFHDRCPECGKLIK